MPFIIITGKGGVGKSTFSVALANRLAREGKTVLYFPAENPSPLYKLISQRVSLYPLDFEREAKEYVKIKLRFFLLWFPLTRSGVFRVFSKVIPGFRELIMLGKMWYDWQNGLADFFVFDGLPMGQIVSFLKIPSAGLSSGVGGPAKSDFMKMHEFVRKAKIVIVATPEELPYEETTETVELMKKEGFYPCLIFLNRFWRKKLSPDAEKWIRSILVEGKLKRREKKEMGNLLELDLSLSKSSEKFLSLYGGLIGPERVITLDLFLDGIHEQNMKKLENSIPESALSSLLS